MRMKHYRPISADFTKTNSSSAGSTLSNVFGLNQEQNRDSNKSGGVLLINYKKSTPECSPSNSPFLKSRSPDNAATVSPGTGVDSANNLSSLSSLPVLNGPPETEVPDGLAPIAKTEEMSDDLSEETLVNGESNPNSSTPKKDSDWRLTNGNGSVVIKVWPLGTFQTYGGQRKTMTKKQIEKRRFATETEITKIITVHIQLRMDLNRFLAQTKRTKVTGSASIPTQPREAKMTPNQGSVKPNPFVINFANPKPGASDDQWKKNLPQ